MRNRPPLRQGSPRRTVLQTSRLLPFVVLLAAVPSCTRQHPTATGIVALTREIQGMSPAEVRSLIQRKFGPADRDRGFGDRIEQWDVEGGVLELRLNGLVFLENEVSTRLIRTTNLAEECLFGAYEMFTSRGYYLGTVTISADGRYRYEDSSMWLKPDDRAEQEGNHFLAHPAGAASVVYATGVGPRTRLEELASGQPVATVTFSATGGHALRTCPIVADPDAMQLVVHSGSRAFQLTRFWVNHWR